MSAKLKEILEKGRDWERYPTNVPGVFILRMPSYKSSPPRLCVEINPVNNLGQPIKKRGLIIRDVTELEEVKKILSSPKTAEIVKAVDETNPSKSKHDTVIVF